MKKTTLLSGALVLLIAGLVFLANQQDKTVTNPTATTTSTQVVEVAVNSSQTNAATQAVSKAAADVTEQSLNRLGLSLSKTIRVSVKSK